MTPQVSEVLEKATTLSTQDRCVLIDRLNHGVCVLGSQLGIAVGRKGRAEESCAY